MSSATVLVVEDSEELSTFISELLTASGYTVLPIISSGEDAVKVAGTSKPDIVLIDVSIGGILDGVESGGRISEDLGIPVIFLSGYTDEKALERAKTKKPSGYLVKPFNRAELKASIEIALYKHRADAGVEGSLSPSAAVMSKDGSQAGSTSELKELRAEIFRLKTEISEYREIIDSLNRSLNDIRGREDIIFIADNNPATP
ncbi:MAG: response regulator [Thermodesulfobacteriota bacterium]